VFVDASHMVMQIPAAWKAFNGPVASSILATMRILSVEMHSVCFTFVAEKASIRRELEPPAVSMFTRIRLQMRIQIFAMLISWARPLLKGSQLTRSHTFALWAGAHS
jgi:hypothetical protein